jgi:hypothetical protein
MLPEQALPAQKFISGEKKPQTKAWGFKLLNLELS